MNQVVLSWDEIYARLQSPIVLPHLVRMDLVRHGETVNNQQGLITGSQDVMLTPKGEEQAGQIKQVVERDYDIAFSSKLKRSKRTLEIAMNAGNIKAKKVLADRRLDERCLGILESLKFRWIPEYARGEFNYAPECGESYFNVAQRVLSFLISLIEEPCIDNVLVCAHAGTLRVLYGILLPCTDPMAVLKLEFPNAQIIGMLWNKLELPEYLKQ